MSWLRLVLLWATGSSLAGAAIGLAVGFFKQGTVETPIVLISILFGNVVGCTAMVSSVLVYPRLRGLPPLLRPVLLGLTLLAGSIVGSIAVVRFYALFVFREPRQALAVVVINGVLALIVGYVVFAYEAMRLRLQESLREVEEVRLAEARLREEAARAELAALQARINPHFFFNTLNTISSLVGEDPDQAEEVVQTLADLFRYTFKVAGAGPVALREELEFTRGYLTIEQARFGPRLQVAWEADPSALEVRVPGLVVQPLVENAVGHGIAPRREGGHLRIAAGLCGERLWIDIDDDGVGLPADPEPLVQDGHGLGNVRRRLAAFYGASAALRLEPNPSGRGARARLDLPVRG
ncbi:MAG TPA: histidine kinase [Candidatus Polarisedimenticolaceae bacterium]|nr:histidine kinase [Candidatus Polarisedimenticolaceae bacterium]